MKPNKKVLENFKNCVDHFAYKTYQVPQLDCFSQEIPRGMRLIKERCVTPHEAPLNETNINWVKNREKEIEPMWPPDHWGQLRRSKLVRRTPASTQQPSLAAEGPVNPVKSSWTDWPQILHDTKLGSSPAVRTVQLRQHQKVLERKVH